MNNLWTVIKKELRRFFTDKRMLAALIIPGIIIFIMYTIMGDIIKKTAEGKDHDYVLRIENRPNDPRFNVIDANLGFEKVTFLEETPADFATMLAEKKLDLYVVYEVDFLAKYTANDPENPPVVTFHFNASSMPSMTAYQNYAGILNNVLQIYVATPVDHSTQGDIGTTIIMGMLPFLLITFLFTGAMAVAPESIAGEKERGTIATLLVTPVKRSTLALGKIIALSIVALVSAASSFLGVTLSLPKMMGSDVNFATLNAGTYLAIFTVLIVTMLVFIVFNSLISAYAKSIKEANGLSAPLMMMIMATGVTTMFGSATTNAALYLIPIYNSVNILLSLFSGDFLIVPFILTLITNLLVAVGGIYLLTVMFGSEKIMFRK
ncbi:MAG: ABC-2 family transporter protein [Tenericutes bacterium ADurb.Bin087]|nr:MAG: ABC-2 family transporter protein [Tenericutes bacterium ADurb.Bin087]